MPTPDNSFDNPTSHPPQAIPDWQKGPQEEPSHYCLAYGPGDAVRARVGVWEGKISLYFAAYDEDGKQKFYAYMDYPTALKFAAEIIEKAS